MARVENVPKLWLSREEIDILHKAKQIMVELCEEDKDGELYSQVEPYETEWCYLIDVLQNMIIKAEVD